MMRTDIETAGFHAVVVHDELPADGSPLPSNIVPGPGGASYTLLHLTPRTPVNRVWDLGCGSGVQSVIAAQHARHVIATDIDDRCIEMTRQSADASGVDVETRSGSLADPVANERFNLIVSNPPFVIGNATSLVHRESPLEADSLTAALLNILPAHLDDGGHAVVLSAWLVTGETEWQTRVEQWLPEDCDVWVGLRSTQTVADYVDFWLADAGHSGDQQLRELWLSRLHEWQATDVAFGFIVVRKRTGENWSRCEDLRRAVALPDGDQVLERLAAADAAEQLTAVDALMTIYEPATDQPWRGEVAMEPVLMALRDRLNGSHSLTRVADDIARDWRVDPNDVLVNALAGIKLLLDLGLAREC